MVANCQHRLRYYMLPSDKGEKLLEALTDKIVTTDESQQPRRE